MLSGKLILCSCSLGRKTQKTFTIFWKGTSVHNWPQESKAVMSNHNFNWQKLFIEYQLTKTYQKDTKIRSLEFIRFSISKLYQPCSISSVCNFIDNKIKSNSYIFSQRGERTSHITWLQQVCSFH